MFIFLYLIRSENFIIYLQQSLKHLMFLSNTMHFSAEIEQTAILTPRFNGTAKIKSSCNLSQTAAGSLDGMDKKKPAL